MTVRLQAEFRELNVSANIENGTIVNAKQSRSFRPDLVLVRQPIVDLNEDYTNVILGLKFGGIPSINSLNSIYNLKERIWIVSFGIYLNEIL